MAYLLPCDGGIFPFKFLFSNSAEKIYCGAQFWSNVFLPKLEFMQSVVLFNNLKISHVWRSAGKPGSALGFPGFTEWEDYPAKMASGMGSVLCGASRGCWWAVPPWQKGQQTMPHCSLERGRVTFWRCLLNTYHYRCFGDTKMNGVWGLPSGNPLFSWRTNSWITANQIRVPKERWKYTGAWR